MNSIYKIVFNKATQTFTAVSELAKGATKTQSQSEKQAGTFLPKFAKITLAISMVLGFSASAIAVTDAEFNALKQQVEALKAQKTYVHVNNGTNAGTGNATTNLGDISTAAGAVTDRSIAIGRDAIAGKLNADFILNNDATNQDETITTNKEASVAIGEGAKSTGFASIAIGGAYNRPKYENGVLKTAGIGAAEATGDGAVALGNATKAEAKGAFAVGLSARAAGEFSSAIGYSASATAEGARALGIYTEASGDYSTSMGYSTTSSGSSSLATGAYTTASGKYSVAMGLKSKAVGNGSLALGGYTNDNSDTLEGGQAYTAGSMALGTGTVAGVKGGDQEAFAMGYRAKATGNKSMVLGFDSVATGNSSMALGTKAVANNDGAIAIGGKFKYLSDYEGAKAIAKGAVAIGANNEARSVFSTVVGGVNNIAGNIGAFVSGGNNESKGYFGSVMGYESKTTGNYATAIGYRNLALGEHTVALGLQNLSVGKYSMTIGDKSTSLGKNSFAAANGLATSTDSIALGRGTVAGKGTLDTKGTHNDRSDDTYIAGGEEEAVAMGYRAKAVADKTLALGFDAKADHTNSVALGSKAETRDFTQVDETEAINGLKYKEFSGIADGVVSVGKTANEKQIINVAPGEISQTSTDAINGSQLYATTIVLGNVATSIKDNLGGNAAIDENGNITFTDIGGTGKDTVQEAIAFNKGNIETNTANIDGNRTAIATKADKNADNLSVDDVAAWTTKLNNEADLAAPKGKLVTDTQVKAALDTKLETSDIKSSDKTVGITTAAGNVDLRVNLDNTSLTKNGNGVIGIKDGGVTTAKIA
ncbi:ESPR-type extended signal peptide-containing protein, partial [Phocoenobacter skyensis]